MSKNPAPTQPLERKLVRRIHAAEVLECTPRTIDRMIRSGRLKIVRIGSLVMIRRDSLEDVIEGRA